MIVTTTVVGVVRLGQVFTVPIVNLQSVAIVAAILFPPFEKSLVTNARLMADSLVINKDCLD